MGAVITVLSSIIIGALLALGSAFVAYDHTPTSFGMPLHAELAHAAEQYTPPLKQVEGGTLPEDVTCRDMYVLAIRMDQSPVCITEHTAEAMLKRGGIIHMIIGPTAAQASAENFPDADSHDVTDDGASVTNSAQNYHADNKTSDHTGSADDIQAYNQSVAAGTTAAASITASTAQIDKGAKTTHNYNDDITNNNDTSNSSSETASTNGQDNASQSGASDATDSVNSASSAAATAATGSVSQIPASSMTTVNIYITDDDLNIAPNAAEIIPASGLVKVTINGIPIRGPDTMTETGPDTGRFYVKITLPETINGRPLNHNDIVDVTYVDQTDISGEQRTVSRSFALSSTYAQMHSEGSGGKRIGHEFTLSIYEPDANRDSKKADRIPLNMFEFEGEGRIRATLDHGAFDANRNHMIETGPNTGVFEVTIKIPRQIDGKTIHIGDKYEITYHDYTTPSGSPEKIVLSGRIGL